MSTFDRDYFSLDGGLNYRKFVEHFKNQAKKGFWTATLTNNQSKNGNFKSRFTGPSNRGSVVIVDLADRDEKNVNKNGDKMPRVEVVDPAEAERRRALDRVALENRDKKISKRGLRTKGEAIKRKVHSGAGKRKNHYGKSKGNPTKAATNIVKRARDIFDN